MKPIDNSHAAMQVQDSHLNAQGLDSLKSMGRDGDPEALRQVAKKFESLFVQQMLKNMRSANEVFGEDSFLNSSETKFHQQMLDQQLSLELTSGRGMGLADMLFQQMQQSYGEHLSPDKSVSAERGAATDWVGAPATGGKTQVNDRMAESPEDFIAALKPHAEKTAAELNVGPDVLLAQAALETGWGRHVIHNREGDNSHNLFNIKADQRWQGERINVATLEYREGMAQQERADFRQYEDYAQSFSDYAEFLQNNPRYQQALQSGGDSAHFADELQRAGYATDPEYAEKIKRLLNSDPVRAALDDVSTAGVIANDSR